jgi:hypothetical protein
VLHFISKEGYDGRAWVPAAPAFCRDARAVPASVGNSSRARASVALSISLLNAASALSKALMVACRSEKAW